MNKYKNSSSKDNALDNYSSNASVVAQFTIYTSSTNLSTLLNVFHENDLNISAFNLTEENDKLKFKFIASQKEDQISNDINLTRSLLKEYRFRFDETKVVRIKLSNQNSVLAYQYGKLIKDLSLYNAYTGENGSIIYETCCPIKTLRLLNELSY